MTTYTTRQESDGRWTVLANGKPLTTGYQTFEVADTMRRAMQRAYWAAEANGEFDDE